MNFNSTLIWYLARKKEAMSSNPVEALALNFCLSLFFFCFFFGGGGVGLGGGGCLICNCLHEFPLRSSYFHFR